MFFEKQALKLHFWLTTKHAHKLGSEQITNSNYSKCGWSRTPAVQNSKVLKVEFFFKLTTEK